VKTALRIYREHGLRKLYLGLNPTILRESFLGVYFGTYDFLMRYFKHEGKVSKSNTLLAGGLAGVATWTAMYPVDYVKTRIQNDSLTNPVYRNSIDCFRTEIKKGVKQVFLGF
jgi:hypothetical protein